MVARFIYMVKLEQRGKGVHRIEKTVNEICNSMGKVFVCFRKDEQGRRRKKQRQIKERRGRGRARGAKRKDFLHQLMSANSQIN